mmetsp:Transcript_5080/g.8888  ORF Transcript_5080/g.8888 Transcript_5080/m.8888 type:complete len:210 (+) Transcript_5080:106-735(+)
MRGLQVVLVLCGITWAVRGDDPQVPKPPVSLDGFRLIGYGFIRDFMLEDYEYILRMESATKEACALECGLRRACKAFTWRVARNECDLERVGYFLAIRRDAWADDEVDKDFQFFDKVPYVRPSTNADSAALQGPMTREVSMQTDESALAPAITIAPTSAASITSVSTSTTSETVMEKMSAARSGAVLHIAVVLCLGLLQCATCLESVGC